MTFPSCMSTHYSGVYEYIAKASMIYGRGSAIKFTKYQEQMNEMAKCLCMENPDLVNNRALLIQKSHVEYSLQAVWIPIYTYKMLSWFNISTVEYIPPL